MVWLLCRDPPREDSKATIHRAYDYGVDVKMITGDQVWIRCLLVICLLHHYNFELGSCRCSIVCPEL